MLVQTGGVNLGSSDWNGDLNKWNKTGIIFTATNYATSLIPCCTDSSSSCEFYIDGWQLIDLTALYGVENEPTSVDTASKLSPFISNKLLTKLSDSNLLPNEGDFEVDVNLDGSGNGWDKYSAPNASFSIDTSKKLFGSCSQKFLANSAYGMMWRLDYPTIQGHKYLFAGSYYTANNTGAISTRVNDASSNWQLNLGYSHWSGASNTWNQTGVIFTATANATTLVPCYIDNQTCEIYMDGWRLIDLTALYGSGNEPQNIDTAFSQVPFIGNSVSHYLVTNNVFGNEGDFEIDTNNNGVADEWLNYFGNYYSISDKSYFGNKSQKITTSSQASSIVKLNYQTIQGHKYLFAGSYYVANKSSTISTRVNDAGDNCQLNLGYKYWSGALNAWNQTGVIFTATANSTTLVPCFVDTQTCEIYLDGWKLVDLTELYEAGNEPSDVDTAMMQLPFIGDLVIDLGGFQYQYDSNNCLVKILKNGQAILNFEYDQNGNLIRKY